MIGYIPYYVIFGLESESWQAELEGSYRLLKTKFKAGHFQDFNSGKNPLPAVKLIIYSEEKHLVNSKYKLLTGRQQFRDNISTPLQSHCQTIYILAIILYTKKQKEMT